MSSELSSIARMKPMNRKEMLIEDEARFVYKKSPTRDTEETTSENRTPPMVSHSQFPNFTITPVTNRVEGRAKSSHEGSLKISIRYADITPPLRDKPSKPKSPPTVLQPTDPILSLPKGLTMLPVATHPELTASSSKELTILPVATLTELTANSSKENVETVSLSVLPALTVREVQSSDHPRNMSSFSVREVPCSDPSRNIPAVTVREVPCPDPPRNIPTVTVREVLCSDLPRNMSAVVVREVQCPEPTKNNPAVTVCEMQSPDTQRNTPAVTVRETQCPDLQRNTPAITVREIISPDSQRNTPAITAREMQCPDPQRNNSAITVREIQLSDPPVNIPAITVREIQLPDPPRNIPAVTVREMQAPDLPKNIPTVSVREIQCPDPQKTMSSVIVSDTECPDPSRNAPTVTVRQMQCPDNSTSMTSVIVREAEGFDPPSNKTIPKLALSCKSQEQVVMEGKTSDLLLKENPKTEKILNPANELTVMPNCQISATTNCLPLPTKFESSISTKSQLIAIETEPQSVTTPKTVLLASESLPESVDHQVTKPEDRQLPKSQENNPLPSTQVAERPSTPKTQEINFSASSTSPPSTEVPLSKNSKEVAGSTAVSEIKAPADRLDSFIKGKDAPKSETTAAPVIKRKARLKISPRLSDSQRTQRMAMFVYSAEPRIIEESSISTPTEVLPNNTTKDSSPKKEEPEPPANNENEAPFGDVSSYCYNMTAFPKCVVQLTRLPSKVEKVFLNKFERLRQQGIDKFAHINVVIPDPDQMLFDSRLSPKKHSPKTSEGMNRGRSTSRKRKSSADRNPTVMPLHGHGGKILRIRNGDEVMCTKVMNKTVEPSEKTRCTFCGKLTQSTHVWRHLLAVYKVKADIDEAIEDEDDSEMFQCNHCGAKLCSKAALGIHCHHLHGKANQYECKCPCCYEPFLTDVSLACHMVTHYQEILKECRLTAIPRHEIPKYINCSLCHKTFSSVDVLENHLHIHNSQLKHNQCKICLKIFSKSYQLKCHMVVHTELRPFKCEQCNKTFRFKSSLRSHNYYHIGVQPYKCKVCDKGFFESGNMLKHMRNIHRENTGMIPDFIRPEKKVKRIKLVKIKSRNRNSLKDGKPRYRSKLTSNSDYKNRISQKKQNKISIFSDSTKGMADIAEIHEDEAVVEEVDKQLSLKVSTTNENNNTVPAASISPATSIAPAMAITPVLSIAPTMNIVPAITIAPVMTIAPAMTVAPTTSVAPARSIAPAMSITPARNIAPIMSIPPGMSIAPAVKHESRGTPVPQNDLQARILTEPSARFKPETQLIPFGQSDLQKRVMIDPSSPNISLTHIMSQQNRPMTQVESHNITITKIDSETKSPPQFEVQSKSLTHLEQLSRAVVHVNPNRLVLQAEPQSTKVGHAERLPKTAGPTGPIDQSSLLFHLLTSKQNLAEHVNEPVKNTPASHSQEFSSSSNLAAWSENAPNFKYSERPPSAEFGKNCVLCEAVCMTTLEMADHLLYYHRVSMNKVADIIQA